MSFGKRRSGERLIYIRPDGVRYIIHAPPSRAVLSEEGFGMPPLEYVTDRAPFQHGDSVRSYHLNPRQVQLVVLQNFCGRTDYWAGRAALLDAIRPSRAVNLDAPGKLLYYLSGGAKRQLDVLVDTGPGFAPPQGGWREWSFTEVLRFTAHDPAWYDPTQQLAQFVLGTSPAIVFPITFPITFSVFGSSSSVQYNGTWVEYPSFEVVGPVTGLRIENLSTGKSIGFNYSLPADMSLFITLRGTKSVVQSDGANLLGFLTDDSDLTDFGLEPDPIAAGGLNQIYLSGTGTSTTTAATMRWYSRYIGI